MARDAWRLALGTFTAIRVAPPHVVDQRTARGALMLAPLAAAPLALGAGLLVAVGREFSWAPLATAALVVGILALGSRAFHLDGLADTADGLTASYERERSLAIMKTGDVGPAGVAAIVIVLVAQVGSIAAIMSAATEPIRAAAAVTLIVMASRSAPAFAAVRSIPNASTGIGASFVGSVGIGAVGVMVVLASGLLIGSALVLGVSWWRGAIAAALLFVVVAALVHRAVRRLGGVVGDIFGAAIEISLALTLLALS